jgi:hypothetical protein
MQTINQANATDGLSEQEGFFRLFDNPALEANSGEAAKTVSFEPQFETTTTNIFAQPSTTNGLARKSAPAESQHSDELCERISARVADCVVCGLLDLNEATLLGLAHNGLPETVAAEADLLLIAHGRFLHQSLQQLHRLADDTMAHFQEVQAVFAQHVLLGKMLGDGQRAALLLLKNQQDINSLWALFRTALNAEGLLNKTATTPVDESPVLATDEEAVCEQQSRAEIEERFTAPLPPPVAPVEAPLNISLSKLSEAGEVADNFVALPPLPGSNPAKEIVSPTEMAKVLATEISVKQPRFRRDWLTEPEGENPRSNSLVYQAGSWCLRTSLARRFDSLAEADAALRNHLEVLGLLDDLVPPNNFFVLSPDQTEHYWFWTVSPWLLTLEAELKQSVAQEDEVALAATLCKYAEAILRSLQLALRRNVLLNIEPSSFATTYAGGPLVYLDDEMGWGTCIAGVGQQILARAEEYAKWKQAIEVYLDVLGVGICKRFKRDDIHHLDLLRALRDVPVTSETMYVAQARLLERVRKIPE